MLKASIFKKKKVPPEKFLVVVNAWGMRLGTDFGASDFNNVGAWFEFMLRGDYPGVGIQSLYYQRTHRNIIVELPREVKDITNYLGRHFYSKFLTNSPLSEKYADIYEYKYATHGDPGEKNWSIGYPAYKEIPKGIPLANPYPCPGTADPPPIDVRDYAFPVPPVVYERRLERYASELQAAVPILLNSSDATSASSPSSIIRADKGKERVVEMTPNQMAEASTSLYTPYTPPSHLTASLKGSTHHHAESSSQSSEPIVKKMDPYEEEEMARQSLFSTSSQTVKDEADDFLSSLLGTRPKKEEHEESVLQPESNEDDYEPSTELLAMLGTLPPELIGDDTDIPQHPQLKEEEESDIKVKPEPLDEMIPDYTPSEDLLEALSSLPTDIPPNEPQNTPRVKIEFRERDIKSEPAWQQQQPPSPTIKREAQNYSIPRAPIVKSEPLDDDRAFDLQSRGHHHYDPSRDPRIRERDRRTCASLKPYCTNYYSTIKQMW
ncbi:hypothetical protein BDN70DRAFT_881844 [Pholiota conissans]|uniref:Uncharacterized protein n=1 Tax=Pholiota conissans TaxID=109636 RepID=A0A9P5YWQ0_9AGAR|nr:hypothetical protein BDN70DRAFT_881844 [Pholiota conissans]